MIARLVALLRKSGEWIAPIAAVSMVFVMLVPLPSFILDLLLTISITASMLVLLTAIQILRPVQFSVFPSLLLLLTLLRLSLDLASTRRILLHGNEGTAAAGKVIEAFGQFVVGGNYIVGFVLFLALIAIQFLVISHGAVRTAEVTARFTLDAMPGKQMAIDADLNAGIINEAAGQSTPGAGGARGGILRRDGWRGPLQSTRFLSHHSDHGHQHRRRLLDRSVSTRCSLPGGAEDLHHSYCGRWIGDHPAFLAGLGRRRHCRHPGRIEGISGRECRQAALQ